MRNKIVLLIALATVASAVASSIIVRRLLAQSTGGRTPLIAYQSQQFFRHPTGEYVTTEESVFAVRSDGSQVEIRPRLTPAGATAELKTIIDTLNKKRVVADGLTE
jgi:hypothetical protein